MISDLKLGYDRFRKGYYKDKKDLIEQLAHGQKPKTAMVSCCDSRVDPGILFDAAPGELFIVRNVANLVPPYESGGEYHGTSAALEFAVNGLQVEQIVVLGHAQCGGIRALMESSPSLEEGSFISKWMQLASNAKNEVMARDDLSSPEEQIDACEQTAVMHSLNNLLTFPWIRERVINGNLRLTGCFYDLRTIQLTVLREITKESLKS